MFNSIDIPYVYVYEITNRIELRYSVCGVCYFYIGLCNVVHL